MTPAAGERALRFVGDRFTVVLGYSDGGPLPEGWRALLRTNLGRAAVQRHEIIHAQRGQLSLAHASWRDIPMTSAEGEWRCAMAVSEVGYFRAKAYAVDPQGGQHWPEGPDIGISTHPDSYRTANTIYCAFVRMFGETRTALKTSSDTPEIKDLDGRGYTVIPPSGTFRDLIPHLPHIIDTLGCRILHLLPVNPTPTTYARMGRFGSPYACLDLMGIDPALVEFDQRTTGVDQFCELTYATHLRGGRVFLDVVANHTGWGSTLQETHPEWYLRSPEGAFVSPGAWGVTWEDLTELDHRNPQLWEYLAEVFLTWCRRGVDGFRCDAGYKVPVPAWRYITARVREEYPETIFLLEGLGGSWEATENLVTEGGMQWAYSELFQNYSGPEVAGYLDYCLRQSHRVGLYVHYSETHDNERLSRPGRAWSLLRNQLCALTSVSGGFGFTCGVEWLAAEQIQVHQSRGLAWGNPDNIVRELSHLNQLLVEHPCFLDGAILTRLSPVESPIYALGRVSAEGLDRVLVLVNTDIKHSQYFNLSEAAHRELGQPAFDLVHGRKLHGDLVEGIRMEPGGCLCLAAAEVPAGLSGHDYRVARAQAAWAIQALSQVLPGEEMGPCDWRELAKRVRADPAGFLGTIDYLSAGAAQTDLLGALDEAAAARSFPRRVVWQLIDARRITPVPPDHWLLVEDATPFRASLSIGGKTRNVNSIAVGKRHLACFPPHEARGDAALLLERYTDGETRVQAGLRFLDGQAEIGSLRAAVRSAAEAPLMGRDTGLVLLTNGIGGMARMQVDLGTVKSKYDCVLGANLHPNVPIDRHIFVKRVRVWVVADGFITSLDRHSLVSITPGPPARWRFAASAGDGRAVEIELLADMLPEHNTTLLRFTRPNHPAVFGKDLPSKCHVSLTVRIDIEDRNFHTETYRNEGSEHFFATQTRSLVEQQGFDFGPAPDRYLKVHSDSGLYHHDAEWSTGLRHPVEESRGQAGQADAYSPGWFELPMPKDATATITLHTGRNDPPADDLRKFDVERGALNELAIARAGVAAGDAFGRQLTLAIQAFVVKRGGGKTVIAGYPWFLDWGRDSLICARGLLSAGMREEVRQLLVTFGRFVEKGTLPNSIHGEDASNRDTSDAPLWYGMVCEELAELEGPEFYGVPVDQGKRTIADVLREIATGYRDGTANGIRMDPSSGLIWSPSHFTWMDTNYPASTPREGYPIEIQVLWIRLLRQLGRLGTKDENWTGLAQRAEASLLNFYWLDDRGYLADLLIAKAHQSASEAVVDTALRSNYLFAISLDIVRGEMARRALDAAIRHLIVPGALRSLAPLPVSPPLPIYAQGGRLLNDPELPYFGRYEGDEDTHRKPAYHNGTAWTWTFPVFCEALAKAWGFDPAAVAAAKAYLLSLDRLLIEGCLGQLPEIVDGDAPHGQRGCDAQAWSATEALRVWKLLNAPR